MQKIFLAFLIITAFLRPDISCAIDPLGFLSNHSVEDYPNSKSLPPPKSAVSPASSAPAAVPKPVSNKPAPKYSMKPILDVPKDEPPSDFVPEQKEAAKTEKTKAGEVKKPKAKTTIEAKKDKKVEKPQAKVKKPAAAAAAVPKLHKPMAVAKPAATKPAEIKPQIVKVETNAAAAEVAKEKVPEQQKPVAKVETKEVPKVVPKAKVEVAKSMGKSTPKAEFDKEGDVEKLKFTFSAPVAAAVFERFGYYWLVFYTDDKIEMPDIKKSQIFNAAKAITPVKTAIIDASDSAKTVQAPLIFNLEMVKNAFAMAQVKDNIWEIDFDPGIDFKPDVPLKLEEKPDSWQVAARGLSGRVTVKDDFTNDYIEILPLSEAGFNPEKTSTAKFIFEKTVQGIVIKPIGQAEIKSPEKGRLQISKDSGAPDKAVMEVKKPNSDMQPLYHFKKWPQLKGDDYRKAGAKVRDGNPLDFGKFLFSQGLYTEAAVNLQGERGLEASFLTGVSYYMLGRFEDALKIFDSLVLPGDVDPRELLAWQAAAGYELDQISPATAKPVDLGNFYLPKNIDDYPEEIHNRLIFSLIAKLIVDGKYDDAQKLIDFMPKTAQETPSQSYIKYLQGKLFDGQGKHAHAREIWAGVAKAGTDRESQAKSSYEMIIQDYNGGKIKIDEAIAKLNDIRIMWRGDFFEYNLLTQLGDLYAKNNQPYEALKTYKEILSSFPNFPHNLAIANNMRDIYAQVVTNNFSDKEKTFTAVTIYYEFEELKPPGEKGDQITLQLADALAKYDLLKDAVKVLQKYAANLTDPTQKAEIGTRIAILQFLDNKAKEALQSLQETIAPNLPNYLVQERRILQVRCLIETGDIEKATSMLSSLPDEQANRFKADIYWKQKKWQELVDIYGLINDKNDDDIMRISIAEVMLDDKKAMQALSKKYGAQMAKGEYADSFDYITDTENVDYRNLAESLQLDKTESLMQKYRERIKTNGLAAVTGKDPTPEKTLEKLPKKAPDKEPAKANVADKAPPPAKK